MSMFKLYKVTCSSANVAYNVLTGTTSAPSSAWTAADKGAEYTAQNQTAGSIAVVGGSDVISNAGIQLVDQGASDTARGRGPSSIQVGEMWVASDTAGGIVVVRLRKYI